MNRSREKRRKRNRRRRSAITPERTYKRKAAYTKETATPVRQMAARK